ncbi:Trifunctional purine biosynthetic protein adenosine-3, partial [Exaiptasia diaphana]
QVTENTNPENRVTIENLEEALDRASVDVNVTNFKAVNMGFKKLKVSNGDIKYKKRIGVLISGSGTNLQALIDRSLRHDSSSEIVLVVSNKPGVKGLERAQNVGIPTKFKTGKGVFYQV